MHDRLDDANVGTGAGCLPQRGTGKSPGVTAMEQVQGQVVITEMQYADRDVVQVEGCRNTWGAESRCTGDSRDGSGVIKLQTVTTIKHDK